MPSATRVTTQRNLSARVFATSVLKLAVTVTLISWLLSRVDLYDVIDAFASARFHLIVVAYAMVLIGNSISVLRWRILLKAQGHSVSIPRLFQSYLIGQFFNNLFPSTIGGDTSRAYDSWRFAGSKQVAIAVIFTDRFLGFVALLLFALLGAILAFDVVVRVPAVPVILLIATALMGVVWWIMFVRPRSHDALEQYVRISPVRRLIDKGHRALLAFRGRRAAVLHAFGLSVSLQLNVILHYYVIAAALDMHVPITQFLLVIPLALFIMAIPLSVNAIGIRENVFSFLFLALGATSADGVALAWFAYALALVQGVIGGVLYAMRRRL